MVGVLAVAGCAPSSSDTAATTSSALPGPTPNLPAGDMSNGAANFYTSDRVQRAARVVQEPVRHERRRKPVRAQRHRPQYDQPRDRGRPPDGGGQGAKRQPLRDQDGRAWLRHDVAGPVILGCQRRATAQRGLTRHLRRGLQRRRGLPAHPVIRRQGTHRRARDLRQRQLRDQRSEDRPAHQVGGHRQHVRHGRSQPRRAAQRRHPRTATPSPAAGRRPARRRIQRRRNRVHRRHPRRTHRPIQRRSTGSSTTSTAPRAATAPTPPRTRR